MAKGGVPLGISDCFDGELSQKELLEVCGAYESSGLIKRILQSSKPQHMHNSCLASILAETSKSWRMSERELFQGCYLKQ
jgi:hypothetical protein